MKPYYCDVLVIGGGGGALRAAIAAREEHKECHVLLATKGRLGKSGVTATACSDRMAFHATLDHTSPGGFEAWRHHADDIYNIGGQVSDQNLAEILASNAGKAFDYLDTICVPFVKKGGLPHQFVTDGSEYPRACYTGPKTAIHIEEALLRRFKEVNIPVIEHSMAVRLLTSDNNVAGALIVNTRVKDKIERVVKIEVVFAKTIIIATGGAGLIYKNNVFPVGMTGDGYAMAYAAGAELVNMEFIQIGLASVKTKLNCSGSIFRAIPCVTDENGDEFLVDYFPPHATPAEIGNNLFRKGASWPVTYEHATHIIDIAVYKKIREGHRVFLDYSRNPYLFSLNDLTVDNQERYRGEMVSDFGEEARHNSPLVRLKEINPDSVQWLREHGIDLEIGEKLEIAACGQHFQGGVKINEHGETTVSGLYAVGETAGGQHGANRPGGNALLDCQVFGLIAGKNAAEKALASEHKDLLPAAFIDSLRKDLKATYSETGLTPLDYRRRLQAIVDGCVSVVRTESGLKKGLKSLRELAVEQQKFGFQNHSYVLENLNLLLVAEMVIRAALCRDESRGPHLRFTDEMINIPLPSRDEEWRKYIVIIPGEKEMLLDIRTPKARLA